MKRSPVGDGDLWKTPPPKGYVGGRFRANWQIGVGAAPTGELYDPLQSSYPGEKEVVASIDAKVPVRAGGRVYYLVNNLPYAQRLEDGWSKQAPKGMVGLTVLEFQQVMGVAVSTVRR